MTIIGHRRYFLFFLAVLLSLYSTVESTAEENRIPQWTIADMVSLESGISFLRYGALGLGAHPYGYFLPAAGLRVNLDGVPLRSVSPFGPDLECVPSQWVDSLEFRGFRELNIVTVDVNEEEPKTDTSFLIGSRHRFNFDMTFNRRLGEKTGIFIGGSSSGIHGSGDTEKNSLRNYFIKYQRFLENGSIVNFSMRALRDRDGLIDLDNRARMGERKTDNFSVSLGIKEYPVSKRIIVSPVFYYQSGLSRFDRYGLRKSLNDDTAGLNVSLSSKRGNTTYCLFAAHDIRFFDSRIHNDSWTRNESEITASFTHENDNHHLMLRGGFMNSSEYGAGTKVEGEIALLNVLRQEIVMSGFITDEYPDTDKEYYSSLVFSDTSIVSKLKKYNISELEGGLRFKKKHFKLGLFGFGSSSKLPLFKVSSGVIDGSVQYPYPTHFVMSSRNRSFGYRMNFDFHIEKYYQFDMKMNYSSRLKGIGNNTHDNWPYPSSEFFSDLRISGKFLNEHIGATVFGSSGFLRWNDGNTSPHGNYFLLDCGILIKVSTLELFYKIENVTNEDIWWFNTMGWLERNSMWGGKWVFYD